MLSRVLALAVALLMATTAFAHTQGRVRCLMTGQLMSSERACCQHSDSDTPSIGRRCCEALPATAAPDLRAPIDELQLGGAPATFITLPPFAIPKLAIAPSSATCSCGHPPGERLRRLTSILRI